MKCSACSGDNWKNTCEREYKYRSYCRGTKEGIECDCVCQESLGEAVVNKVGIIGTGAAMVGCGVALTVLTGGFFGALAGGAVLGLGGSYISNPVSKILKGEKMNEKEFVKDLFIGGVLGAATGPISLFGNTAAAATSSVVKAVAARVGAGAVSGAISGAACSTISDDATVESVIKTTLLGATVGAATGGAGVVASKVANEFTSEVAQAAARIGVSGVAGAGIDVVTQLVVEDDVDLKRVAANAVTGMTQGALFEGVSAGAKRTNLYAEIRNDERITERVRNPAHQDHIRKLLDHHNNIFAEDIKQLPKGYKVQLNTEVNSENMQIFAQKVNGKLYYQDHKLPTDTHPVNLKNVDANIRNPFAGQRPKKTTVIKSEKDKDD